MLLNGPVVHSNDVTENSTNREIAAHTITQIIQFNCKNKSRPSMKETGRESCRRYDVEKVTPVAIYIAFKVHGKTQSKTT